MGTEQPGWPTVVRTAGPLCGVKVLDLSRVLAGPFASMLLADMGADVIKVEHPQGDETRRWGPPFLGDTAVYYLAVNRNKRSVRLDLKDPDDCRVAHALADEADVIIENFKPGVLERFGLDHESVKKTNPECIYASITAFGSDSPRRDVGGYDLVVQAMGGIMSVTGEAGGPPVKVGVASADLTTGMYAAVAVLGALYERLRGGGGRNVEVALMDAQVASLANQSMNWLAGGLEPEPLGSDHPNVVPYGAYATATGYLVLAVGSDGQFVKLCDLIDRPDLAVDPRFATNAARVTHRDELRALLEPVFVAHPTDAWLEAMDEAGVPGGPVRSVREVFEDPEVNARMVRTVVDPHLGPVPQVISPFRFDGASAAVDIAPPALGAHDAEVIGHVQGASVGSTMAANAAASRSGQGHAADQREDGDGEGE